MLQWKKRLEEEVVDAIPNLKTVEASWCSYCFEEKSNVINQLELLSGSQGKMLIAIAIYGVIQPPPNERRIFRPI